ncbi:MAG: type II and III secretion system protein [Acidobacteria bacterium]|nr:MAG: type II and III secretion system protein [Acidobacteriota bacterium]
MRRLISPAAIVALLLAIVTVPAIADKAKSLFNQAKDAEARQNYEAAYDLYKQAYDLRPRDLAYRASYERLRFLAAASHVHRGQLLRDAGKLEEALAEFQKAAEIDASSFIAQQEIRRTQQMIDQAKNAPAPQAARPPTALRKMIEAAGGPIQLTPISNVPITLKLTEDTKVIYDTVGKLAGINVLFDPDYTSRRIRIELNGVTLNEALEIIALESKTFWRPVTPNTIFVASDTPAKRKEVEQSVIKTFYLSNVSTPQELQDMVNAMRQILEIARIQQLPTQNAIVVRGTPDQIALAGKLIDDLDKSKSEVIVDVAIMQVSRDKVKNYGINPPTSATVTLQQNINSTNNNNSNNSTNTNTTNTPGSINLNRLGNLNATDFQVTIPSATATALFSDSSTKIIQQPQIRAVDGQKASLKIGERVPVATGSFQPGIGGVGINPLVNTQFQYLDVGVNIDITPHVHAGREVTLKVAMDISSVTGTSNIGGISQPIIGQRKVEHEIRLKEGEVNLLGGILEDTQTRSLSGIPGLANIPLLKYLFSQTNTDRRENEIVFALIPHIVRGQELSEMNERAIDVGTANAIELRQIARPPQPAAQPGQGGPGPQPQAGLAPQQQPGNPPPPQPLVNAPGNQPNNAGGAPAAAAPGAPSFIFDPPAVTAASGSTFTVNVLLSGAQNVSSVPVQINYDPARLQVVNVSNGGFLSQDGQAVALVHRDDASTGTLQVTATRPPGSSGVSGQGAVVTITFMAKAGGQSNLSITRGGARDASMQPITVAGAQAAINVQ